MSLRTRLTIGMVGTLAVAIFAGLVGSYFVVRGQLCLRDRQVAL